MLSLYYISNFLAKLKKGVLKEAIDVIKLATHGRDMRKYLINKYVKTTNYNIVAVNAFAVAIGYTISLNNIWTTSFQL